MRIGLGLGTSFRDTLDDLVSQAQRAERGGFASVWLANIFGFDALTVLMLVGRETERVELATGVVLTYPRHPFALAQQALTVQAATGGRLTLGIGLSHRHIIEDMLGLDFSRPIAHAREYLTVLNGLLAGQRTVLEGEMYRVAARLWVPEATKPPVLLAALGPDMLRLAGRLTDGILTWMGGLSFLRDVAVPTVTKAAARAGRPAPRIAAGVPVCVTDDPAAAREAADQEFVIYGQLPSYRATLDRAGAAGPGDVAMVGNEQEVEAQIRAFADAGVTDFDAAVFPVPGVSLERTFELLQDVVRRGVAPAAVTASA